MCEHCGRTLPERNNRYCCKTCANTARRAGQVWSKAEQYDELEWLMSGGVEPYDALRRCGIPTADAAYQWALRHGRVRLVRMLRESYNGERAAQKRARRAARKTFA